MAVYVYATCPRSDCDWKSNTHSVRGTGRMIIRCMNRACVMRYCLLCGVRRRRWWRGNAFPFGWKLIWVPRNVLGRSGYCRAYGGTFADGTQVRLCNKPRWHTDSHTYGFVDLP